MFSNFRPNVLIVDDQPGNIFALKSLLKNAKANVLEASSAQEALEILLKEEVAVALLDVQMPDIDGFELAGLMRGNARTKDIPIIFITAGAPDSSWQFKGYDAGAIDFLFKPLDSRIVLSKVNVLLTLYRQRLEIQERAWMSETARKQTDFLNAKLEAEKVLRERFVAALSHDLRTPLTATRLAAQLIEAQLEEGHSATAYARKILKNMDRADRMITDLLDVSRLEAGHSISLTFEKVRLTSLLKRIASELNPLYGSRIHVDCEREIIGNWNEESLQRLLENLISNAVKYGHRSAPITLAAKSSNDNVELWVHNSGNPIPPEEQSRLFDRFHRAEQAGQNGKKGWGIGLAICRGISAAHGGSIKVESDEASGTKFTIALPLDSSCKQMDRAKNNDRTKILLIDDKEPTRTALKRILEQEKFLVLESASGTDGLELAAQELPDLVISSTSLVDIDGNEVCRRIKASGAVKVMLLHSHEPEKKVTDQAVDSGADALLSQLSEPESLLQQIHGLIGLPSLALTS